MALSTVTLRGFLLLATALQVAAWNYTCCSALSRVLPDEVFSPGSSNATYTLLNDARWSKITILTPSCIFQPASTDHVSEGVKVLTANSCKFAIKAGGHNPIAGANDIDGGVSVDLGLLNSTELSADRKTVSLGTGGHWGAAYDAFASEGVIFPGGLCGGTGVGGVVIGGGESYLQPRVGWGVDNVLNYEVVLGSGDIVNANQGSYSDLYKALKGGGSNFGIVTRVDLAGIEQPNIWAGQVLFPALPQTIDATLQAVVNLTAEANINTNVGAQITMILSNDEPPSIGASIASTDNTVNPVALQGFTALQPQTENTLKSRTLSDVIHELDTIQNYTYRDTAATITFANDYTTLSAVHNVSEKVFASLKDVPHMDFITFFMPSPRTIETYSAARGGNVLGLTGRDKDLIVAIIVPRWLDAAYDERMLQATEEWIEEAKSITVSLGTADPYLYHNFAAKSQKPFCGYGSENLQFLRRVSSKYDPEGVFQKLVPGGHKISTAC